MFAFCWFLHLLLGCSLSWCTRVFSHFVVLTRDPFIQLAFLFPLNIEFVHWFVALWKWLMGKGRALKFHSSFWMWMNILYCVHNLGGLLWSLLLGQLLMLGIVCWVVRLDFILVTRSWWRPGTVYFILFFVILILNLLQCLLDRILSFECNLKYDYDMVIFLIF